MLAFSCRFLQLEAMQSFLTTLSILIAEKDLPALMIGGHAIQQPARDRVEQDWSDVIALIKAHQLSLDEPEFSAIICKHGGKIAIQRIRSAILGGG